jgi:YegS/Rv2252/BmrU family lipid kinase
VLAPHDPAMRATVIINPVSGPRRRTGEGQARAREAQRVLARHGLDVTTHATEYAGHARALAAAAAAGGAGLVIAWGGDGTVNEVASALVHTGVPIGVVPSGSGNGLANELGVPRQAEAALEHAVRSPVRRIDAGEIAGRVFLNVAGLGIDARIAHRFNARRSRSHGLRTYVWETLAELRQFTPIEYQVTAGGERLETRAFLVAIANSPQYGNGARIAPGAKVDDGRLDLVIAEASGVAAALWRARRLFTGSILRDARVRHRLVDRVTVASSAPIVFHVDGEPGTAGNVVEARVLAGALLIRA